MKFLKVIVAVVIILSVLTFLGFLIFLKTIDVNVFRTQITQNMSSVLGHEVKMDGLSFDFSLLNGIILNIQGLSIAQEGQEAYPFLVEVKRMRLDVDLMAFVRERKILVSKIILMAPQLVLIRERSGEFNIQKLTVNKGGSRASSGLSETKQASAATVKSESVNKDVVSTLLIKNISVNDGRLIYIDKTLDPALQLDIKEIGLSVSDFSLKERFEFSLVMALLNDLQNTNVRGYVQLDLANERVRLDDFQMAIDLAPIEPSYLSSVIPHVFSPTSRWAGMLEISLTQLITEQNQLLALSGSGKLKNGRIGLALLVHPVENINLSFNFSESGVDISRYTGHLSGGTFEGSINLRDYLKQGPLHIDAKWNNVPLQEFAMLKALPVVMEGSMGGEFLVQGQSHPTMFFNTLQGGGSLKVNDGRLVDVNVLRLFLSSISMIPNLVEKIENTLPEKYKAILQQKDTIFENVIFEMSLRDGRVHLTKADIEGDSFSVTGNGYYGFDQNVYLDGALSIPEGLSASMTNAVPELSSLLNDNNEIYIPIAPYEGPLSSIKIFPDVAYLAKKIVVGRGKQELQSLIDKALGTEELSPEESQPSQEKSIEKEIIGNILDNIFGK